MALDLDILNAKYLVYASALKHQGDFNETR
jgi:hypothetical protein